MNETIETEILQIEQTLAHPELLGSKTEIYERISGYYRSISNWNAGKKAEEKERKSYKI